MLCAAGQCNMMVIAHATARKVEGEPCDGREVMDPPSDKCDPEMFLFEGNGGLTPPEVNGEYHIGDVIVAVPYMDFEESEEVSARVAMGENPIQVINEEVGPQPIDRQWTVNFGTEYAPVTDGSAMSGGDCHSIAAPD